MALIKCPEYQKEVEAIQHCIALLVKQLQNLSVHFWTDH